MPLVLCYAIINQLVNNEKISKLFNEVNRVRIGLIGLPMTGKTTFFNLLTRVGENLKNPSRGRTESNIGIARIPDARVDYLAKIYKPKKITYATIEVIDIHGIIPSGSSSKGSSSFHFLEAVRKGDALVHVVRAFEDEEVAHIEGTIDPLRDIETINMELLFADLVIIENRISRIKSGKKITSENKFELEVLKKCKDCLENENLINTLSLSDEEKQYLKAFDFLTERPVILLINLDEKQFVDNNYEKKDQVMNYANKREMSIIEICAKTELEISQLDEDDRALFMDDLGINEAGISKLASAMYSYLQLISFLTVGEDEVRAWTIKNYTTAKSAGGKIHSDIERGFIRAEVVKYSDFKHLGSMKKVKEKGLFRLEGKEVIIEDGDIINFRFNV